jgi:predicted esterase
MSDPSCQGVWRWSLYALLLALASCGGSDGSSAGSTPARGTLLGSPQLLSTIPAGTLLAELSVAANQQTLTLSGTPVCDVGVYHIDYTTVGGANESTTASAALLVPSGLDARCRGSRPVVLYAHGTSTDHGFNIADLSNQQNAEGLLLAAFFAAHGDIVVAPNYAGYDTSKLSFHPYLVADQQSKDMIDALTAARSALPTTYAPLTRDSGRLFITGYSQGGFVAMATQRAMQLAGMPVTAAAPMSGPYALQAFVDAVFNGEVTLDAPLVTTFLITAYQKAYGTAYTSPSDVFEAQYSAGIESLLPSSIPRSQLYSEGRLPQSALFSSTPPDPKYANITPPSSPANLARAFALGFGTHNLIKNSYRLSYLQDAAANPDGGWPTTTTGAPASNPMLPWRVLLKQNDLRTWVPTAPTLLCGGDGDPTVLWLNTQLMQTYWASHASATTPYSVLDLDAPATSGAPYANLQTAFSVAKLGVAVSAVAQGATDGGASAVLQAYHSTLVPPFCLAAVVSFFAAQ